MKMTGKVYELIFDNDGRPIQIKHGFTELNSLEDVVDELNDLNSTIHYHIKTINKLKSLLDEKVEPTYDDYYLDIDMSTKRCKYENTVISIWWLEYERIY